MKNNDLIKEFLAEMTCVYNLYFEEVNDEQLTLVIDLQVRANDEEHFECVIDKHNQEINIERKKSIDIQTLEKRRKYKYSYKISKQGSFVEVKVNHNYSHGKPITLTHTSTHNVIDPRFG